MADPAILSALSRLNEHARAWGFGKRAIYTYKTFAACAFAPDARPVQVQVKCHHCSGTGTYTDWNGEDRGPCYRCTKGVVMLRFIESTIGDYRWHHPMNGDSGAGTILNSAWGIASVSYKDDAYPHGVATLDDGTERPIVYQQAEGWGPNLPGAENLPTDEACRLLNLVEAWIPDACYDLPPRRWQHARWPHERAMKERGRYRIALEHANEGACCVCGTADITGYRCCSGWRARGNWAKLSRPMCETCHHPAPAEYRWPTEPHPTNLTPAVMEWLEQPWRREEFKSED